MLVTYVRIFIRLLLCKFYSLNVNVFQEFRLIHYAGDVTYNVRGFLEKNNDLLFRDLREVMSHTTNSITKVK